MRYRCQSCQLTFESEGETKRPRCPSCMRMSSVVEDGSQSSGLPQWAQWAKRPSVWGLFAGLLALGASLWVWLAQDKAPSNQPGTTGIALEGDAGRRLSTAQALWLLTWRHSPGVTEASTRLIGTRQGAEAAAVLADLVKGSIQQRSLVVLDAPVLLPRRAMPPWLFGDETLSEFLLGQSATLYPDELTVLLWVIARQAGLEVELVWLEPQEPTVDRWPCVALRLAGLVLDPRTGDLLQGAELTPFEAELLWAGLGLIDARYSLGAGDLEGATQTLAKVERLVPDLWTTRALRAHLLHTQRDQEKARAEIGNGLGGVTHPYALYVGALVAADRVGGQPLDLGLLAAKLQGIVDANPGEARLAVELGDLQRRLRQYAAAWDAYDLALSREPNIVGAHTGMAWLYALGDPARAQEHIRQELRQHAQHAPVYLAYAFLLASMGQETAALEVGTRGRRFAPDSGTYEEGLKQALDAARLRALPP